MIKKETTNMIKSVMPLIIYVLTLAVIICAVIVVATCLKIGLGFLPSLIAVYCTTATLSRAYNLYLNNKESK